MPMQGVQAQGSAIDSMFNTYYKSAGNARQNALLELQKQNTEFNQGLQQTQEGRRQETHALNMEAGTTANTAAQLKLTQEQGRTIYDGAVSLKGITDPAQRVQALGELRPKLLEIGMTEDQIQDGLDDTELDYAINAFSRFKPAPTELKTGRFRTFESEDGATYRFDSATGETATIQEGETPDISILPEGLQNLVKGQPREIQQKCN